MFSTCAVRENADNKLDGNLGHLKPVKDRTPGMQIAVGRRRMFSALAGMPLSEYVRRRRMTVAAPEVVTGIGDPLYLGPPTTPKPYRAPSPNLQYRHRPTP